MRWLLVLVVLVGLVLLVRWARRQTKSRDEPPCGLPIESGRGGPSASDSGARRTGELESDYRGSDGGIGDD